MNNRPEEIAGQVICRIPRFRRALIAENALDSTSVSPEGNLGIDSWDLSGRGEREQKMLKGHLLRVIYHQVNQFTKIKPCKFFPSHSAAACRFRNPCCFTIRGQAGKEQTAWCWRL